MNLQFRVTMSEVSCVTQSSAVPFEDYDDLTLAPYAAKSKTSRGRRFSESEDTYRNCYQRDRDRIIYSTAFKNLQYKTQVFVVHEGDFYRTRMTHTLEVMQHARTFARVLRSNEDLVEAIALAHDLGHTPFGHAGEEILSELLQKYGGFDHNLHSLRVVDRLEQRYPQFSGLNLTYETREGLARHLTRFDNPKLPVEFATSPQPGIEAQIVNLADSMAFAAHDLDDALRIKLVDWEDLQNLPIPSVRDILNMIGEEERQLGGFTPQMRLYRFIRFWIYHFNEDCIIQTRRNLEAIRPDSSQAIRELSEPVVTLSPERTNDLQMLINFLYNQVYKHPLVLMMAEKGKMILRRLFEQFMSNPRLLPVMIREKCDNSEDESNRALQIADFLAGLTDRQAMDIYEMMFEPYTKVMGYGFNK